MKSETLQIQINPADAKNLDALLRGEPEEFTKHFGTTPVHQNKDVPVGCAVFTTLYTKETKSAGNIYELFP